MYLWKYFAKLDKILRKI